ncbi:hypothetical protein [Leptolyngbya sp. FACHB-17]|uniref:hypothetical protein n=1 Tax=unclassified Leptolyngbya TaxID=2650499 RepID=UPI001680FCB4|nr:hypothetical protein [Leptolyngbya sp. FACHB-17]MBD2080881.1 hypothetical protein [Leptolyngbya sp. FACHB-17]
MAFKDSWQQQRQYRLQQVVQRRQAVSLLLQDTQKQRQAQASQLRSDLSLFRETLSHDARVRREALQNYCESLHQQTQEFLAIAHAERDLASQQLRHDLHQFRATLTETVTSLQQSIQVDLQRLQTETRSHLEAAHRARIEQRIQLTRDLTCFVEKLRSDVAAFLTDAALERQEKALQAQHDRKAEMTQLFAELAEFRSQLQQFRANLAQTMWGDQALQPALCETPHSPLPTSPTSPKTLINEKIYEYIEVMQSVRLTELESALSMTRIQVVEGLRSLIQQGKITQRDRMYLISTPV